MLGNKDVYPAGPGQDGEAAASLAGQGTFKRSGRDAGNVLLLVGDVAKEMQPINSF